MSSVAWDGTLPSRSTCRVFGYGEEGFLHQIRENLLTFFPDMDCSRPAREIIQSACRAEVMSFLHDIEAEHSVLLYNNYGTKEEMLRILARKHLRVGSLADNASDDLEMPVSGNTRLGETHSLTSYAQAHVGVSGAQPSLDPSSFLRTCHVREAFQNF